MITELGDKTVEFKGITLTMKDLMCLSNVYKELSTMELIEEIFEDVDLELAWEIAGAVRERMEKYNCEGDLETFLIEEEYEKKSK